MTVSLREVPLKGGEFSRIIIDIYYSAKQRERQNFGSTSFNSQQFCKTAK